MKITYINKDFLSEGYIKTVDKMKDSLGKKHTADDIRKEAKKFVIEPILEDREFLRKCGNCFKPFIHVNANTTPPGVLNFKYVDLKDKVLTVICDAHYTGNASQRNLATAKSVLLEDDVINTYSVKEINNQIDDYCTKYMLQYLKKNHPELLEYVERIHIERINLWANAPESVNGVFPGTLTVKIQSEFYTKKILTETELNELLNKVNSLFSFCARTVLIEKLVVRVEEHKDKLANDIAVLLDGNKTSAERLQTIMYAHSISSQVNTTLDKVSLNGLTRKDLHEFTIAPSDTLIDLHEYLINNDIKKSTVKEIRTQFAIAEAKIITTANYSEIEQVKDQLTIILTNSYPSSSYRETEGKYLPTPKSGVIEYLAFVKYYSSSWNIEYDIDNVMDYVNGEYHSFSKILLPS